MPKAIDRQRLTISHDPNQRLDTAFGKLPPIDIFAILSEALLNTFKALTGIDLSTLQPLELQDFDLGALFLQLQADLDSLWRSVIEYNLNVLNNPLLETADALEAAAGWTWDPAVRHGFVGGSANVAGDGLVHQLGSDPILPVAPGQNIAASTWVRWRDIACSGPAFQLVLYRYDGTNSATADVIGQEILESFSNPVEDSSEFFNNDFIKLDGNYTITDTDTRGVRLVWRQTANVVAGQSWWHDASMTKASDDFTRKLQNIDIDGNFDLTKVFNQLPASQVTGVGGQPDIGQSIIATIYEMFAGWFQVPPPDTDIVRVAETFEAIRATVAGGYTLQTFTSSNASWPVPPELKSAAEAYIAVVGGGGKGTHGLPLTAGTGGSNSSTSGGLGGTDGGYVNETIDPSTLGAALAIVVGAAATTSGTNGGTSSVTDGATVLASSVTGAGGISSVQGYLASTSTPGVGGKGGGSQNTVASDNDGSPGTSNPAAAGGAGGTGVLSLSATITGGTGGHGVNGKYTTLPIAGGGGGGGGGGANTASFGVGTGGVGGTGGFPGGGSGGGGGADGFTEVGGAAGTPANGLVAIYWR